MSKHKNRFSRYEDIHEDFSTTTRELKLMVPSNFRMLCALFETSPSRILSDFMWTLSSMPDSGTDEQRKAALEYFMHRGYAQKYYPEEEVQLIFRELEAKRILWPGIHDNVITPEQRQLHCMWSNMFMQYWFEKWYGRYRKRGEEKPMKKY